MGIGDGVGCDALTTNGGCAGPPIEADAALGERLMASEDHKEALRAFMEKRRPVFRGR